MEDVLSIVKLGEDNHLDSNHELSQEDKISLDKAINLAWSNDDWGPLLEIVFSGGLNVFNYQHSLTGLNPLMVFAGKGKVGDMCMLLSIGANCHLRTKDGTTALDIAVKENQQVAAELLKKHINIDFSYMEGNEFLKNLKTVSPELLDVVLTTQLIRKICIDSKDGGILVFQFFFLVWMLYIKLVRDYLHPHFSMILRSLWSYLCIQWFHTSWLPQNCSRYQYCGNFYHH